MCEMSIKASFVAMFVAVLAFAGSAQAQDKSSWGVSVDVTPHWEQVSFIKTITGDDFTLEGQEIRFGLVRGRVRGGDWGVSLVYGKIDNKSFSRKRTGEGSFCRSFFGSAGSAQCVKTEIDTEYYFSDVSLLGLEVHKYVPFVTIANRVQVGMNFGGGATWAKGSVEKHDVETQKADQPGGGVEVSQTRTVETITAKEAFRDTFWLPVIPTGRIEVIAGVIATENLKIKIGGGVNFPGQHKFTVGVAYLF